ncbi:cytochrome C [bacterium]|nr:cytochrome C [bacterium]
MSLVVRILMIGAVFTLPAIAPASAQKVGDADAGLAYASRSCAGCHAIDPLTERSPNPAAPTFRSIASAPGMTLTAFNVWMTTGHKDMPHLIVPIDQREDLYSYIATMKRPN